jgi:hypothetical protein
MSTDADMRVDVNRRWRRKTYSSGIVELGPAAKTGKHEETAENADPEEDHGDANDLSEAEDFDELGTGPSAPRLGGCIDPSLIDQEG